MTATKVPVDIRALAKLARLEVSDAEVAKLEKELPGIMDLVAQVQQVAGADFKTTTPAHRNVTRIDADPIEPGTHMRTLIDAAPAHEKDQVAVKQVLSRKK